MKSCLSKKKSVYELNRKCRFSGKRFHGRSFLFTNVYKQDTFEQFSAIQSAHGTPHPAKRIFRAATPASDPPTFPICSFVRFLFICTKQKGSRPFGATSFSNRN